MAGKVQGYVPAPEFKEDSLESLVDFQLNDNTELWLVQLPDEQFPGLDGQELTLDLDQDGELGSVKGPDGTVYNLVNFSSDVADTTVFQPTPSGTKIAGKVSRHVSFIHYPEPKQLGADAATPKKRMPSSSKTAFTKSKFSTPSRTTSHKRGSSGRSRQSGDSGPAYSGLTNTTVSGSSEQSQHKKSKSKARAY